MIVDLDQSGVFELLYKKITPESKLFTQLLYKPYKQLLFPDDTFL